MRKQSTFRRRPTRAYTLADGTVVTGSHFRRLAREYESPEVRRQIDRVVDDLVDRLLVDGHLDPITLRLIDPATDERAS